MYAGAGIVQGSNPTEEYDEISRSPVVDAGVGRSLALELEDVCDPVSHAGLELGAGGFAAFLFCPV